MPKMIIIIAALTISFSGTASAASHKLDEKGKCHDDRGKFAKQELCTPHTYKLDAKGKCRDEGGKFASAKLCKVWRSSLYDRARPVVARRASIPQVAPM